MVLSGEKVQRSRARSPLALRVLSFLYSKREALTRLLGPDRWPQGRDGTVFHLVPIHYG